ncbi:hypothetical protein SETIT_1G293500v2 [Setaria italica]|uniref:Uncharacterized protein n=2 Tax=Setaria TaxID=4554 RepID=A0A368PQV4_SETIT|nr:uncharacterized protein LOC101770335 isoform X1 [Setaria italica]XP_034570608.1 uncharacterized protein LOC117835352 isoform X1 [Setaria viridis]XP_034570614.1 uncharacterized protein LOC117835352 isoform X1 [Setaria viridis]RCV08032.1 hypothetical protein SETIT_1G293500v2 [Setaria italica]RCV08033.1 hypothetical protein SETIT_1G293500v2 [Setaria italica]TKW41200.1 hypothetical protein SEVIR_1G298700v2 [Setaria viridis]
MEDKDKSDGWDEDLEEADELACVQKYPVSTSFLASGISRRNKSEKKPRFSIRGHDFVPYDVKTEILHIRGHEGTYGVPSTKLSQTMVAERLENIEEESEDLTPELPLHTKKANTSVSELLEDLQGRSGSSVRKPYMLQQHTLNIREQEVSSRVPPAKASQALMAERFGNSKEETEDLPSEFAHPMKKANLSVAELLEDLQGRSSSPVGAASLRRHTGAKDWTASEKKTLAILGESIDSEDPLEHITDGTSSEEEDVTENHLALVNKDVKHQTMADLFQEVFDPSNLEVAMLPMRSTGAGYHGRMQQIMQMEKDRHAEFLRQFNIEKGYLGDSKGITVQIMSRSLEGKLTVCHCLFQEKNNSTITREASTDHAMCESRTMGTIIFSPKICDNVDLLVGNIIRIFPPWKEIRLQEEDVILCTYFSHHGA